MKRLLAIALIVLATGVAAEGPDASVRPKPRPAELTETGPRWLNIFRRNRDKEDVEEQSAEDLTDDEEPVAEQAEAPKPPAERSVILRRSLRPKARPAGLASNVAPELPIVPELKPLLQAEAGPDIDRAAIPEPNPRVQPLARLAHPPAEAKPHQSDKPKQPPKPGSICGDSAIQGMAAGDVAGKLIGCGVADAVAVTQVAGVTLSQRAVMNCDTAKALKTWVEKGLKPAIRRKGGGVSQIKVASHYACRTRNNVPGAEISEHGKGKAIDISGFRLRDGIEITVLKDYDSWQFGPAMRRMRREACGPFSTVLGPGSDSYHNDHFHFDTASYRDGSVCR